MVGPHSQEHAAGAPAEEHSGKDEGADADAMEGTHPVVLWRVDAGKDKEPP